VQETRVTGNYFNYNGHHLKPISKRFLICHLCKQFTYPKNKSFILTNWVLFGRFATVNWVCFLSFVFNLFLSCICAFELSFEVGLVDP
jgi:hypothetical protein